MAWNVSETGVGLIVPAAAFHSDRFAPLLESGLWFRLNLPTDAVTQAGRIVHYATAAVPGLAVSNYVYVGVESERARDTAYEQFTAFARQLR